SGCTIRDAAPADVIPASRIPALMIHGEMDDYVPAFMLKENAAAYGGEYETYTVAAAGHADSFVKEPEEYERRVNRFAEKILSQENEK
ncbi:MAG: alpha/beta hydrolase, partial [Erysipelotrichaceae bacterium]|nr:alpha/beta hydrolase [Erysipelotrichaceae bacterium]